MTPRVVRKVCEDKRNGSLSPRRRDIQQGESLCTLPTCQGILKARFSLIRIGLYRSSYLDVLDPF